MMSDQDDFLRASTKRLMRSNQNPIRFESRGLGLDVDMRSSKVTCSANSFGHSGSTGTLAWAEPDTQRICVVLTTLPARALEEESHPRHLASEWIAKASQPKP
jgi:CubicO group peptidase (beta-lactamase class C family)